MGVLHLLSIIHSNGIILIGVVETASKTIPIVLRSIDIAVSTFYCCSGGFDRQNIYPEGGDLVYGLPCGLYIEAFTPVGDPADITAHISFLLFTLFYYL